MTKKEAALDLMTHDHSILKGSYARKIGKVFGFNKVPTRRIQDSRSQFKGANFPDLKEGEYAEDVIDASSLAEWLCNELDVEYTPMHGRGSALRECCEQLADHFA